MPVMVHVGCSATEDAINLAKHAEDRGADTISFVPPIWASRGQNAMLAK